MIYEVIIFAALAVIVCVMMYSVLGKQVGKGPEDPLNLDKIFKGKEGPATGGSNVVPLAGSVKTKFSPIQAIDASFSEGHFLDGAKAAYSMILEAFASGDKDLLKSLLTDDVYMVYEDAINAREAQNYRQVTDLGRLKSAKVETVKMDGAIARISEVWEYERNLKSSDINWRLADVVPSEGDALAADPTPDTK